ncbi:hypothetical protein ABZ671_27185 [Micromonospora sp. NPDC006766]|uniref:hypothetical protein n=1 Tax=Micromonospora sp. NPDC006766 TaxID=3154778 RepID=UPI0033DD0928
MSGLLIPLLAQQRGWNADTGGLLAGAVALGIVAVALTVTATRAFARPGVAAAGGLALAAAAILALAFLPDIIPAVAAAAVAGAGSGLFTTHVGPLILGGAPSTHLARVQSVLVLAQSLPLVITNNALGSLNDLFSASVILVVCATFLLAAAARSGFAHRPCVRRCQRPRRSDCRRGGLRGEERDGYYPRPSGCGTGLR